MTTGIRKAGDFCWFNMLTPQPDAARQFFSSVLGWTYADIPGMGHLVKVGDRPVGGLFDIASPQTPPGTPPHIGLMVKVADAAAVSTSATALGGQASPPFDIMGNLKMGMVTDPTGARLDLFQPIGQQGTDADNRAHGAPSWFETMTTDDVKATAFYTKLFGWTAQAMSMGAMNYTTFSLDGVPIAGMMPITPEMGPIPSHWGTYFTVGNADACAAETTKLGGTVFIPPRDIPGIGRFCGLISPQGVRFYAIQYAA